MPKERWKVVEGHPNYKVSTLGRVMNGKTGKLLNPYDDGQGYLRVKVDGCNAMQDFTFWSQRRSVRTPKARTLSITKGARNTIAGLHNSNGSRSRKISNTPGTLVCAEGGG